jgi:hypothetical protein
MRRDVSHHDWSGDAGMNSRRRVNSTVGPLAACYDNVSRQLVSTEHRWWDCHRDCPNCDRFFGRQQKHIRRASLAGHAFRLSSRPRPVAWARRARKSNVRGHSNSHAYLARRFSRKYSDLLGGQLFYLALVCSSARPFRNCRLTTRPNKSLDASGITQTHADNLFVIWLTAAASTQPFDATSLKWQCAFSTTPS